jgi:hypothetical protein
MTSGHFEMNDDKECASNLFMEIAANQGPPDNTFTLFNVGLTTKLQSLCA